MEEEHVWLASVLCTDGHVHARTCRYTNVGVGVLSLSSISLSPRNREDKLGTLVPSCWSC